MFSHNATHVEIRLDLTLTDSYRLEHTCKLIVVFLWFAGEIKDGYLRIGETKIEIHSPENKMKVPDVVFYDNVQV